MGKGKFWRRIICVGVAFAMLALSGCADKVEESISVNGGGRALSTAYYPERPKYPQSEAEWSDEEVYDAWRASLRERRLGDEELGAMEGAWAGLLPALLGDGGEENMVCSPANVYVALSMLAECAGGESRAEVLRLLGGEDMEAQRALTKRLWEALYNDDGSYTGLLANSVWLRSGDEGEYDTGVLRTLAEDYYASSFEGVMGSAEYDSVLRDWLNGQTKGLLEEQTGDIGFERNTVMALASTAYFADNWAMQFEPERTEKEVFHAPGGDVERDFMKMSLMTSFYMGDKFTALELPFERGGSMRLLLPNEGVETGEILESRAAVDFLTRKEIPEELKRANADVDLSMPRFDVASDGDIIKRLEGLGVMEVFDRDKADFTPLIGEDNVFNTGGESWSVYVDAVLHGARVKADESGCEAAAYTVMLVAGAGMPQETIEVDFVLDRPFVFSLMSGGVPMFAGVVNEP